MSMARYHEVIRVNQDGAVRICLTFVPLLKMAKEGKRIHRCRSCNPKMSSGSIRSISADNGPPV